MQKKPAIDAAELSRRAHGAVLSGLARGDDVDDVMAAVAPNHVPGRFTPDVALLELRRHGAGDRVSAGCRAAPLRRPA